MTPGCLKRMMRPYEGRLIGEQGTHSFPHSVMALGVKTPAPVDFDLRAQELIRRYGATLAEFEASLPLRDKIRRRVGRLYRSKGERRLIADYYRSEFQVETGVETLAAEAPIMAGREIRADVPAAGSAIPNLHDPKEVGKGSTWRHPSIAY